MDLSKCCIFCENDQDLTISMSVKVGGISYNVSICADHEDDASPRMIRERVGEVLQEIEKAKKLLNIWGVTEVDRAFDGPTPPATPAPAKPPPSPVSTKPASGTQRPIPQPPRNPTAPGEPPKTVAKEMERVTTPGGEQRVIPKTILDAEGGRTEVRIVNTGGDKALQKRFKGMADRSKADRGPDFVHNYDVKDCPVCGGSGINAVNKGKCPKCDGGGILP